MSEKQVTFCRICEATCGLEVETEGNRVVAIRPDPQHVVSRGYACVKGTRYASVQHSADRVLQPLERVGDRFEEVSWERALGEIARRASSIVADHGPDALGHFVGSAGGANVADYTPEHLAEKILSSKHALEGERKQVTVLFADAPLPQPRRAGGAPSDPAPGGGRSAVTIQR